ncbi:MAG: glucosamine inositolphosphorylceramide transferase family protein, partial [Armatimonadota bacterium]
FPRSWSKVATLITGFRALDSTVFYHDGLWWLMCTSQDLGPHDTLFLWYATEVLGPWIPHPKNPVKKDRSSTRPAGTPFQHNGRLYRPAQDCSRYYGERIAINRVDRLTPSEFHEETVSWVGPFLDSPYPHGIHTISKVGDMTLIDGKRHKFIKKAFTSAIVRNLRRIARGCN